MATAFLGFSAQGAARPILLSRLAIWLTWETKLSEAPLDRLGWLVVTKAMFDSGQHHFAHIVANVAAAGNNPTHHLVVAAIKHKGIVRIGSLL